MTINAIYQLVVNYGLFAAGGVVVLLMLNRYRKIAASGNVRKMAYETAAPGIMLIVAIAVSGAAVGFALPRVNAFFASEQIQAAVAAGDVLTQAADNFLAAPAGGTLDSYQAPQFEMMSLGGGNQQPMVPNLPMAPNGGSAPAGSLQGLIDSLAAPTLEATPAALQAPVVVPPTATPYIKPTPVHQEIVAVNGGHDRYTVQPGDSMFKIAQKILGSGQRYGELCAANVSVVGSNCSLLRSGMVLKVPSDIQAYTPPQLQPQTNMQTVSNRTYIAPAPTRVVPVAPTATPQRVPVAVKAVAYTVKAGDSIYSIAAAMGADIYAICVANRATLGDNCDNINVGATLVKP